MSDSELKVRDLLRQKMLPIRPEPFEPSTRRLLARLFRRPAGCTRRLFSKFPIDDPFQLPKHLRTEAPAQHKPVYAHGRFVRFKDKNKEPDPLAKFRKNSAQDKKPLRAAKSTHSASATSSPSAPPPKDTSHLPPALVAALAKRKRLEEEALARGEEAPSLFTTQRSRTPDKSGKVGNAVVRRRSDMLRAKQQNATKRSPSGRMVTRPQSKSRMHSALKVPMRPELKAKLAPPKPVSPKVVHKAAPEAPKEPSLAEKTAAALAKMKRQNTGFKPGQRKPRKVEPLFSTTDTPKKQKKASSGGLNDLFGAPSEGRLRTGAVKKSTVLAQKEVNTPKKPTPESTPPAQDGPSPKDLSLAEKTAAALAKMKSQNTGFKPGQRKPRKIEPLFSTTDTPKKQKKASSGGLDDLFGAPSEGRLRTGAVKKSTALAQNEVSERPTEPHQTVAPSLKEPSLAEKTAAALAKMTAQNTGFRPKKAPVTAPSPPQDIPTEPQTGGLDDLFGGEKQSRVRLGRPKRDKQ